MTRAQEAAIARVCAHECLQRELVEALQWTASALLAVTKGDGCAHELDTIRMANGTGAKTIEQILNMADATLGRAKETA